MYLFLIVIVIVVMIALLRMNNLPGGQLDEENNIRSTGAEPWFLFSGDAVEHGSNDGADGSDGGGFDGGSFDGGSSDGGGDSSSGF